jgi:hypothetical protein
MRLFMETSHESDWARGQWRSLAETWQQARHVELVSSMDEADAILVTLADCKASYPDTIAALARSGAYAEHPDKSFVFDTQDTPLGLYPGLYCSLRRLLFSPARHRTSCYMQSFNEFIGQAEAGAAPEFRYLFTFQGNLTSRTRGRLFEANYGRDDVLIERTRPFWNDTGGHRAFKQQYAQKILQSRYVLCPRGIGTSTFRLFETLQSSRVPVILSDSWVPPAGIDWNAVSLRVPERDLARLPEICREALPRWDDMAREARRVWEEWFSPAGMGKLVRSSIEDIRRTRRFGERFYRLGWPLRRSVANFRQTAARAASRLRRRS